MATARRKKLELRIEAPPEGRQRRQGNQVFRNAPDRKNLRNVVPPRSCGDLGSAGSRLCARLCHAKRGKEPTRAAARHSDLVLLAPLLHILTHPGLIVRGQIRDVFEIPTRKASAATTATAAATTAAAATTPAPVPASKSPATAVAATTVAAPSTIAAPTAIATATTVTATTAVAAGRAVAAAVHARRWRGGRTSRWELPLGLLRTSVVVVRTTRSRVSTLLPSRLHEDTELVRASLFACSRSSGQPTNKRAKTHRKGRCSSVTHRIVAFLCH